MPRVNEKNNFIYLTLSLLVMLFTAAALETVSAERSRLILDGVMLLTFVVAIRTLDFGTFWPHFGWATTLALIATVVAHAVFRWKQIDYIELVLIGVLYIGITMKASRQVLLEGSIDTNKIVGSLALYILIGLVFTVIYLLVLEFDSTALRGIDPHPWAQNFSQVAYFSFVTLTTLGYGDITPATRPVEVIVYLEAIVGVFYMAVFVAGLIGSAQARRLHGRSR